jgi:GntR family transcriptional regulator
MELKTNPLPSVEPLFVQIEELIEARILKGEWGPGEALPSEFAFADYYCVSQGTARKAINLLAERNFLERRQGKGTFVKRLTTEREHSHFFHIVNHAGKKILPTTKQLSVRVKAADKETQKQLVLPPSSQIIVIERLRLIDDIPQMIEVINVDAKRFSGLNRFLSENTENELYPVYEQLHGVRVLRAVEALEAINASDNQAKLLEVKPGSALLKIARVAYEFGNEPVEVRYSFINTKDHYYQSLLY